MSKAKDEYSKQVAAISFIIHYSMGPIVNYVTELEKKIVEYEKMLLEQCWNETVEQYGDVLTKLAKE